MASLDLTRMTHGYGNFTHLSSESSELREELYGESLNLNMTSVNLNTEGSKEGVIWAAFLLSVAIISALDLLLGALLLAGTIQVFYKKIMNFVA